MKIDLHIERLVLDGFSANSLDAEAVRGALVAELASLLHAVPPSAASGSALPYLQADARVADAQPHAVALGASVARALHGALGATQSPMPAAKPGAVR